MRARAVVMAGALGASLACWVVPAEAAPVEVVAGVGATTAVEGEPGDGGASFSASLLWPVEDHFRFGLMGFADDLGERRGRLVASGTDLGPVASVHRDAMGLVWRMEARVPTSGRYDPFVIVTWGAYRVTDDLRGTTTRALNTAGLGLGLGVARRVGGASVAALTARYQQLSRSSAQRYLCAAAEWRWSRSGKE